MSRSSVHPVTLELDSPLEVANWRPLVHWLLAFPHYVVLYALNIVQGLFWFISFFAILFTGAIPEGIFSFQVTILRYQWRTYSYAGFLRESYPPFDFTAAAADPGTDPARFSVEYPEKLSRGLIFVKWLLIIPHVIVLLFVGIGAFIALIGAFFAVLFTGRWPQGLRDLIVGTVRWQMRVNAYVYLLTDVYPPFSLQ
jgi:hypothetical protein